MRPRKNPLKLESRSGKKEWRLTVYGTDSKRHRFWLGTDRHHAESQAQQLLEDLDRAQRHKQADAIKAKAGEFLRFKQPPIVSFETAAWYKRKLEPFMEWCAATGVYKVTQLPEIDLSAFLPWLTSRFRNPATANTAIRAARAFLRWLAISEKVSRAMKPLKEPEPGKRIITSEEHERLLTHAPEDVRVMLELLWRTGMRTGELVRLTWDRVSFDMGIIRITGKGKTRMIPVAGGLKDLFSEAGSGLVFHDGGKQLDVRRVAQRIAHVAKAAGVNGASPQTYRRTVATGLFLSGASEAAIRSIMGHVSIDTTLRHYINLGQGAEFLSSIAARGLEYRHENGTALQEIVRIISSEST